MMRWLALGAVLIAFVAAAGWIVWPRASVVGGLAAPSGQPVALHEVLFEDQAEGTTWVVVRVLAPDMAAMTPEGRTGDMGWACATWGLNAATTLTGPPERIVVQMMVEPFPRGEPTPTITQNIETYSVEDATCIWELF